MNNFLNQLNLTPQERRIVAIIFLVVIVVLNFLFVWPHFGEWGSINKQLEDMRQKISDENRTIGKDRNPTNGWQKQVLKLARNQVSSVVDRPVEPQVQLQTAILAQERRTGVLIKTRVPGTPKTNDAFFEEHSTTITLESQEPQLVNFLYNMGNDPAMIRVAKLDLKPLDNNRYRLNGTITLTANYKKRASTAVDTAVPAKPAKGAKPAGPPGPKPAVAPGSKPAGPPGPKPAVAPGAKPGGPPSLAQPTRHPPAGPFSPGARPAPPGGPAQTIPSIPRRRLVPAPGQQ